MFRFFKGRPRSVLSAMGHSVRQNNNNFNGINPMMNQSFHSIDGAGSPWQLEGEIVYVANITTLIV